MAIPACVDPNACGTDVSFTTSGIKVDIVPNNVGCGVDLSCSGAGLTAAARLLANGGIECNGSRELYVDRRGATGASDPGGCYSPVNIDTSGGLWVPADGYIGAFSGNDGPTQQIPVEGGSSVQISMGSLQAGPCDERWLGHFQIQHNITADATDQYVFSQIDFTMDISGLTPDPSNIVTRSTIAFRSNGGTQTAGDYIWVPIVINAPAGQTATFNFQATCNNRDNVAGGAATALNSLVFQGLRISRFAA